MAPTQDETPHHLPDQQIQLVEHLLLDQPSPLPSQYLVPAYCRPAVAMSASPLQIPVIDLCRLEGSARAETLGQIHSACSQWGFFHVVNHGVSAKTMEDLKRGILNFLSLSAEEKCANSSLRGDGEGFGSGFLNPQIGATEWRDYVVLLTFPESKRNPEKWPVILRETALAYGLEAKKLAQRLLAAFSESLQLPPSYIEDALGILHQKLLVSHYPPCPHPELAVGACEHTDVGAVTCVWQVSEDVVGLQVRKDGQWHSIEPLPGALVVNVGDQVEIISNGLYKSGPHRVLVNTTKSRISLVAFHNPAPDAVIFPAPSLALHPAPYKPTLYKEYAAKFGIKT